MCKKLRQGVSGALYYIYLVHSYNIQIYVVCKMFLGRHNNVIL